MKKILATITNIYKQLENQKEYLTSLDRQIGDADHGENMVRGWKMALKALKDKNPSNESELFKIIGLTLLNKVGGASGPLYGMAFVKASRTLASDQKLNKNNFKKFIKEATNSIKILGKVEIGSKTMFDVWFPISEDINKEINKKTLISNLLNYQNKTKNMIALKGRASYLKERSIGTIDPGSASSTIILSHLIDYVYE